jgi:hypothetical protein
MVISAAGFPGVKVVSLASAVEPSKIKLPCIVALTVKVSAASLPKIILPFAVNVPVTVRPPALVVVVLVLPKVIAPPLV